MRENIMTYDGYVRATRFGVVVERESGDYDRSDAAVAGVYETSAAAQKRADWFNLRCAKYGHWVVADFG